MEIIDELEPVRRGFYGGTVGYFGTDLIWTTWIRQSRSARWCFAATLTAFRPARASSPTACPQTEYQEVLAKSAIVRHALALAEEGL